MTTVVRKRLELGIFNKPANHEDTEDSKRVELIRFWITKFIASSRVEVAVIEFSAALPLDLAELFYNTLENFVNIADRDGSTPKHVTVTNLRSGCSFGEFLREFGEQLQEKGLHPEFGTSVELNQDDLTLGEALNKVVRTRRWAVVPVDNDGYFPNTILAEVSGEYMDRGEAVVALNIQIVNEIENCPHGCRVIFLDPDEQIHALGQISGWVPGPTYFGLVEM